MLDGPAPGGGILAAAERNAANRDRSDFVERFKSSLIGRAGRECFSDGCRIAEYADETGPAYWDEPRFRAQGPDKCAEYDMRYWHDV